MALGLMASTAAGTYAFPSAPTGTYWIAQAPQQIGRSATVRRTFTCPAGYVVGQKDKPFSPVHRNESINYISAVMNGGGYGSRSVSFLITNWNPAYRLMATITIACH
jgi:hypothetical protein